MKKALALVLALVLALSLGVSAFAVTFITLTPVEKDAVDNRLDFTKVEYINFDGTEVYFQATAKGGKFYALIDGSAYKDFEVTSNGNTTAKVVPYDPETMKGAGVNYELVRTDGKAVDFADPDLAKAYNEVVAEMGEDPYGYAFTKAVAEAFNKAERVRGRYAVKADRDLYVVEIVVAPNYTAAYTEGSFKVSAVEKATKKAVVSPLYSVICDVTIFEYEEVLYCGENEEALHVGDKGYSDYKFNGKYGADYVVEDLRANENASVISTTAFRGLREKVKSGIVVKSDGLVVTIPEIAASQKGVNFVGYGVTEVYAKPGDRDIVELAFGFYGDQVIASDFTITANLGKTAYELREAFGEKVEEEDVITYYVLKDGKVIDSFTVDYMKDDIDEVLKLEIAGKAGETLGEYEIVLVAPAEPEGEENPNTGAESVIGVVAAMAVVSVAAAAAVSLKK